MPWWGWILSWIGLSLIVGPIVGRMIKRSAEYYPTPEEYKKIKALGYEMVDGDGPPVFAPISEEERQRKAGLN